MANYCSRCYGQVIEATTMRFPVEIAERSAAQWMVVLRRILLVLYHQARCVGGELLSMMVNVGPKPPRDRYRTFTGISYASLCIVVQLEQRAPLLIQIKTTRYKPIMPFIMLGSVVQVHP